VDVITLKIPMKLSNPNKASLKKRKTEVVTTYHYWQHLCLQIARQIDIYLNRKL